MKTSRVFRRRPAARTQASQRAKFLADFERSGLSAAAFARQRGIHYTTFCGWRQRQAKALPAFREVEVTPLVVPAELVIELGGAVRLRLTEAAQVPLAACLLRALHALPPC